MPGSEDDTKPLAIALLYTDKNSCLEAADKLKNMNVINASHLQLKLEQFDQLSMCTDREGLCNLWRILFSEPTPIHVGLLGVSMSGCVASNPRPFPRHKGSVGSNKLTNQPTNHIKH